MVGILCVMGGQSAMRELYNYPVFNKRREAMMTHHYSYPVFVTRGWLVKTEH